MADEQAQPIWEKQEGESTRWYSRFLLFVHLGSNRTIIDAVRQEITAHNALQDECERQGKVARSRKKFPKKTPGSWRSACEQWNWNERAAAYDIHQQHMDMQIREEERKRILSSKYALVHERVKALNTLATRLLAMSERESNIWLINMQGNPQFNNALFSEIRASLADIASEMGERVKVSKQEITGRDGGAIEVKTTPVDYSVYTDEQLEQLKALALKQQEIQADEQD